MSNPIVGYLPANTVGQIADNSNHHAPLNDFCRVLLQYSQEPREHQEHEQNQRQHDNRLYKASEDNRIDQDSTANVVAKPRSPTTTAKSVMIPMSLASRRQNANSRDSGDM